MEQGNHKLESGLWKYELDEGKYYFSPGICRIFNLEYHEIKSHDTFLDWIYPEDYTRYSTSFNENIKKARPFDLAYRLILAEGRVKYIQENVDFIVDEEGKVESYYGIISDVSLLVDMEEKKQDENCLINTLLRNLPNLIFVKNIDAGFKFSFVNDNFAAFYGLTQAGIIGKRDGDISTPEQAKACYISDKIAAKRDMSTPLVSVEEIPISKRQTKYMQTIKFAHIINGTNYLICSAMDITDLVRARQKAEKSDKLKIAFLHSVSHEIRTPMNSIMGYSQLICNSGSKKETELFSEKIRENSELLLNLINNIIYLSNLEAADKDVSEVHIDMELFFAGLVREYEYQAWERGLEFIYKPHSNTCNVYADKEGLVELMRCFLNNAMKFTKKGEVSMGYDVEDKGVRVWVKDTGIGFDKKDKKKVLKRFVKLDEFTPGIGIGLYISHKIVKLMKGKIGIDSAIGKGTTIWADLPLEVEER